MSSVVGCEQESPRKRSRTDSSPEVFATVAHPPTTNNNNNNNNGLLLSEAQEHDKYQQLLQQYEMEKQAWETERQALMLSATTIQQAPTMEEDWEAKCHDMELNYRLAACERDEWKQKFEQLEKAATSSKQVPLKAAKPRPKKPAAATGSPSKLAAGAGSGSKGSRKTSQKGTGSKPTKPVVIEALDKEIHILCTERRGNRQPHLQWPAVEKVREMIRERLRENPRGEAYFSLYEQATAAGIVFCKKEEGEILQLVWNSRNCPIYNKLKGLYFQLRKELSLQTPGATKKRTPAGPKIVQQNEQIHILCGSQNTKGAHLKWPSMETLAQVARQQMADNEGTAETKVIYERALYAGLAFVAENKQGNLVELPYGGSTFRDPVYNKIKNIVRHIMREGK